MTREGVKAALDRVKAKGWEVVFLGANFDNIADASSVGVGGGKQMAMSAGTMNESMARLAKKSRAYGAVGAGRSPDRVRRRKTAPSPRKRTSRTRR